MDAKVIERLVADVKACLLPLRDAGLTATLTYQRDITILVVTNAQDGAQGAALSGKG